MIQWCAVGAAGWPVGYLETLLAVHHGLDTALRLRSVDRLIAAIFAWVFFASLIVWGLIRSLQACA
jgi:hypothetical protein